MDRPRAARTEPGPSSRPPLIASATMDARQQDVVQGLARMLGPGPFALVILFISPQADMAALIAGLDAVFADTPVMGCTTAGEIGRDGYAEGQIVAVALPSAHFGAEALLVPDLDDLSPQALITRLIRVRQGLIRARPDWQHEFAFLLVDGLSIREDELTAALASGLGPVPLFGGSAGDGTRFKETFVLYRGKVLRNAAVLAMVRSDCRVKVFSLDHLVPTDRRMVVTEADPRSRTVRQINAEPAAREYARLLGKDPAQLTTFTFAAHPVVVRIGGKHHVRAIRQVADNGDLVFFSAIDEGLVLTLAEPHDMVAHLRAELGALAEGGAPDAIIACDCILRRMEAMEKQRSGAISALLQQHRVLGFSTYGEQLNSMHVNQTLTGVAIYPPEGGQG
ncbi:MAG: FIST C-terminal domain-containing protein [Rhodobacter sp.]|nr:FIST C-terminal domain-containing protein [Rhodobacter sp.]MCA3458048.1 FIST C-terminal domain-containing protein [Rhodobacter sp.]MCA3462377.1 FIST C-terminal domain-containing protein [Rhodobacter sp.]MCA3463840.1 FIST C-terminal domain-containing protein [Rhodobacter sp.]MCA3466833.1 FIST C-terminal domain-containing protein [Rhodobacter sp.]